MDPDGAHWGSTEELLAALCELTDYNNRLFLSAHTKPGVKLPEPLAIPRPWKKATGPRKQSSREEVARFFKGRVRKPK